MIGKHIFKIKDIQEKLIKKKINIRILIAVIFLSSAIGAFKYISERSSNNSIENENGKQFLNLDREDREISTRLQANLREEPNKSYDVIIRNKSKAKNKEKADEDSHGRDHDMVLEREIARLGDDINAMAEGKNRIELPKKTKNGKTIDWKIKENGNWIMSFLLIPLYILFDVLGKKSKDLKMRKEREADIIKHLPAFVGELRLMIGSGLTIGESLRRIILSDNRDEKGGFADVILKIKEHYLSGEDVVYSFKHVAIDESNPQMSRIANIVYDGHFRGVHIIEKLEKESEVLWKLRLQKADERGKLIETTLTMPLGIILLSLIIITSAPAIIQL